MFSTLPKETVCLFYIESTVAQLVKTNLKYWPHLTKKEYHHSTLIQKMYWCELISIIIQRYKENLFTKRGPCNNKWLHCSIVVIIQLGLNSGSEQVQVLFAACQQFAMMITSTNGSAGKFWRTVHHYQHHFPTVLLLKRSEVSNLSLVSFCFVFSKHTFKLKHNRGCSLESLFYVNLEFTEKKEVQWWFGKPKIFHILGNQIKDKFKENSLQKFKIVTGHKPPLYPMGWINTSPRFICPEEKCHKSISITKSLQIRFYWVQSHNNNLGIRSRIAFLEGTTLVLQQTLFFTVNISLFLVASITCWISQGMDIPMVQ